MDERTRLRLIAAGKAFSAVRNPEFRDGLPVASAKGQRPIVVVLRDDPLRYLLDRVDDYGGAADIVVDLGMSVAVIAVTFTPDSPDVTGAAASQLRDDAPAEMLVRLLREYGLQRCHMVRPHIQTRLVGERELLGSY